MLRWNCKVLTVVPVPGVPGGFRDGLGSRGRCRCYCMCDDLCILSIVLPHHAMPSGLGPPQPASHSPDVRAHALTPRYPSDVQCPQIQPRTWPMPSVAGRSHVRSRRGERGACLTGWSEREDASAVDGQQQQQQQARYTHLHAACMQSRRLYVRRIHVLFSSVLAAYLLTSSQPDKRHGSDTWQYESRPLLKTPVCPF